MRPPSAGLSFACQVLRSPASWSTSCDAFSFLEKIKGEIRHADTYYIRLQNTKSDKQETGWES